MNRILFKRLDHILITIPEGMRESAEIFYKNILGLEPIPGEHPKGALWFVMGDIQLHVRPEPGGKISDRHAAFEVEDLEAAKIFLKKKSIAIFYSSEIDGRQRCFFRDPFDNRFELLQYAAG